MTYVTACTHSVNVLFMTCRNAGYGTTDCGGVGEDGDNVATASPHSSH